MPSSMPFSKVEFSCIDILLIRGGACGKNKSAFDGQVADILIYHLTLTQNGYHLCQITFFFEPYHSSKKGACSSSIFPLLILFVGVTKPFSGSHSSFTTAMNCTFSCSSKPLFTLSMSSVNSFSIASFSPFSAVFLASSPSKTIAWAAGWPRPPTHANSTLGLTIYLFSMGAGETYFPLEVLKISFVRPVILRRPMSSSCPLSPVRSHPSSVMVSLVASSFLKYPIIIPGDLICNSPSCAMRCSTPV
mmetsp:Transcript_36135/g.55176  ORF Transcript_36135/g.55176 Transcript_36135/m.55176 type:complete len:247 (-) Transcript_36135:1498-2238(-)